MAKGTRQVRRKNRKGKSSKRVKEHVIPLEQLSNRPLRHAGHKDTALAVSLYGQWIGFTKAYLTHAQHTGNSFHQAITPYTTEGRELQYRKTKKHASVYVKKKVKQKGTKKVSAPSTYKI